MAIGFLHFDSGKTYVTMLKSALLMLCMGFALSAQAEEDESEAKKSKGEAIVKIFGDLHSGFGSVNDDRGFNLERCYLGYEYEPTENLTIKAVMDVGKSSDVGDHQRFVHIKTAMVAWEKGDFKVKGGLISTTQFKFQEDFWDYRYVMKSFQDEYKFGHSADLGVSASYEICDEVKVDAIITNGEGYKKLQVNDGFNYGLGLTLTPVKGLKVRLYGGLNEGVKDGEKNITNLAAMLGYKHDKFSIGAEYNYMMNAKYKSGADLSGYSLYTSVKLSKKISLFARYDDLFSKNDWNLDKDESAAILGAHFKLGKYVRLSPNFRMCMPKADNAKTGLYGYINYYFHL